MTSPSRTVTCADPAIEHLDRHGYLFGYPIAHSLSPLFHQTVYDHLGLRWSQLPLESTDISQFLRLLQDPKLYGKTSKVTPTVCKFLLTVMQVLRLLCHISLVSSSTLTM